MASKVALHFLCFSLNSLLLTVSTTERDDAAIMKRLASQLSPTPFGWETSNHPCNWSRIYCDTSLRVSIIDISSLSLSGTLPSDLNSLSRLTKLYLDRNHLTGSLPSLANLRLLRSIDLYSSNFTLIPDDAFASLNDNPKLTSWTIPTQLAHSRALRAFTAKSANLGGSIPDIFSSFPSLQVLDLSFNHLSGSLPPSLSATSIIYLSLSNQTVGLSGPLYVLGNMTSLQWLMLDGNKFTGPTPDLSISRSLSILKLQCNKLQGQISPAFGNLKSLVELHLNNNSLAGLIPESLAHLINLKTLDVSNNNISPPLPHFASNVNFNIFGNPLLPVPTPTRRAHGKNSSKQPTSISKRKTSIKIILLILFGAFLASIFVISILVQTYIKREHHTKQQREAQQLENSQQLLPDNPVRFTYEVLKAATNNFDKQRALGGGGFGSVFEATLSDGTRVAVKRLEHFSQGKKEFQAEVRTMGSIQHFNLVRLVGFCAEKTYKLLVYEYMSNGSLDKWIFHNNSRLTFDWETRKKIILHIAMGLAYLHEECIKRTAHLDVKPQNALLDEGFNAKLSDFGLAKLIDRDQSHVMTQMRGTRGHLAPEWLDRKITEKADVYSYGVLMLEVVFERKNLDSSSTEESDNRLIQIVRKKVEASQLSDLVSNFSEDMQQNNQEVENTIKLALRCLHLDPK